MALKLLCSDDEARRQSIANAVWREILWLMPRGREVGITVRDRKVSVEARARGRSSGAIAQSGTGSRISRRSHSNPPIRPAAARSRRGVRFPSPLFSKETNRARQPIRNGYRKPPPRTRHPLPIRWTHGRGENLSPMFAAFLCWLLQIPPMTEPKITGISISGRCVFAATTVDPYHSSLIGDWPDLERNLRGWGAVVRRRSGDDRRPRRQGPEGATDEHPRRSSERS